MAKLVKMDFREPATLDDVKRGDQAEKVVNGQLVRYRDFNPDTRRFEYSERIGDVSASLCYSPLFVFLFEIDGACFYTRDRVTSAA